MTNEFVWLAQPPLIARSLALTHAFPCLLSFPLPLLPINVFVSFGIGYCRSATALMSAQARKTPRAPSASSASLAKSPQTNGKVSPLCVSVSVRVSVSVYVSASMCVCGDDQGHQSSSFGLLPAVSGIRVDM